MDYRGAMCGNSFKGLRLQEYAAFRGGAAPAAPMAVGAGSWLHYGSILDRWFRFQGAS